MPPPVFWRKLTAEERAALDAEIRRSAYADTHGISAWLADRGVSVGKSAVHQYARKLKKEDDALSASIDDLPPETTRLIVKSFVLAMKAFKDLWRSLETPP